MKKIETAAALRRTGSHDLLFLSGPDRRTHSATHLAALDPRLPYPSSLIVSSPNLECIPVLCSQLDLPRYPHTLSIGHVTSTFSTSSNCQCILRKILPRRNHRPSSASSLPAEAQPFVHLDRTKARVQPPSLIRRFARDPSRAFTRPLTIKSCIDVAGCPLPPVLFCAKNTCLNGMPRSSLD